MGSQNLSLDEAMRAQMRVHLSLIPLATLVSPLLCQLKFNGGVSSSSSNSNSPSANRNTNNNNRPTDVDEKFFFGGDTPSLTGNQALDGGIVGLGLGALGAAVLGPTIQGALNGGQQSQGYSCGRRKRQANFGVSQTSAWHQVLWRALWWATTALWQLLLQQPALQQQQRVQQQLPEPGLQQPKPGIQQPRFQQPKPGFQQPKQRAVPVQL